LAANALQFVFMGLCAMLFPFSVLPHQVLLVSRAIPLSYCVDAFRSTLMGYPEGFPELLPIETEVVIVTVFGLVMPVLGYGLYKIAEKHARVRGTLGEY
jgi:ABC-type multidrug transport system permease subunit